VDWNRFANPLNRNPERAPTGTGGDTAENWAKSRKEVADFSASPPDKYVLYINEGSREATTWMGHKLGDVTFGRAYRTNMGDTRVPITVRGINGVTYVGTYYKSAGDYARVRRKKR
jgi:hypothetical protein